MPHPPVETYRGPGRWSGRSPTTSGPPLVAVLAAHHDSRIAHRWARGDGPAPPAESRLRLAHRVWDLLPGVEGEEVARLWFLGANPWLGEVSPVEAIAQGRAQEVLGAAQAVIEDRYTS